jgi:hypothetical protein
VNPLGGCSLPRSPPRLGREVPIRRPRRLRTCRPARRRGRRAGRPSVTSAFRFHVQADEAKDWRSARHSGRAVAARTALPRGAPSRVGAGAPLRLALLARQRDRALALSNCGFMLSGPHPRGKHGKPGARTAGICFMKAERPLAQSNDPGVPPKRPARPHRQRLRPPQTSRRPSKDLARRSAVRFRQRNQPLPHRLA